MFKIKDTSKPGSQNDALATSGLLPFIEVEIDIAPYYISLFCKKIPK
jgi:hypothetical protein